MSATAPLEGRPAVQSGRNEWTPPETVFAWSVFPVVMSATLFGCIALMQAGYGPFVAVVLCQLPAALTVAVFEHMFPHHRRWNLSRGDVRVDLAHFVTITLANGLAAPAMQFLGAMLAALLAGAVGLGLWPSEWPLIAQLALSLVIGELVQYWVHRLQHERPWLWRFHATHHSAPRLYWFNAARFHFVDIVMNGAYLIPLVALGAPPEVFALWLLFSTIHGIFQHANLKMRLGPLNYIFSMAELHRWHHSRLVVESNTNYGQNLAIWDLVFGTRLLPRDRQPPSDIGLTDLSAFPMTYLAQLLSPLRWREIEAASAAGLPAGSRSPQSASRVNVGYPST